MICYLPGQSVDFKEKGNDTNMKFKKILMVGYSGKELDQALWDRIDQLTEQKVLLSRDSSEIAQQLRTCDGLLVKLGAPVDREMIDRATNLRYIGILGIGYGKIDVNYAAKKDIAVCNLAGYFVEGVAEFAIAAILEHIRELERAKVHARQGDYSEATFQGSEIKSKVFGVIGLGRIGGRIAELALNGFGADVRYWSRRRKESFEAKGVRYQEVDALIKESDFLSLNLASVPDTANFLSAEKIRYIKTGAVVINLAPMELVDINGLEQRLKIGDITFILDHSDDLSPKQAQQLAQYNNCIMYPPIGYITREATSAKLRMFVDNLENYLKGTPSNKVN